MTTIFYDLETSDREPIGQIINFSFIACDASYRILDEYSDQILLSALQLPSPHAILANRTNVLTHQKEAGLVECDAMKNIYSFIDGCIQSSRVPVMLVGYNSARFDLPYLRTSMIRNGISPYFKGKLQYGDLLFLARMLAVREADFPRTASASAEEGRESRLSLTLENLSQQLGLLDGRQVHSSRDDVLLTIDFAQELAKRFGCDVRRYNAYEAAVFHARPGSGEVVWSLYPEYDLNASERAVRTPMVLLDADRRYALWIDLNRFQENPSKEAIRFMNVQGHSFILDREASEKQSSPQTGTDLNTIAKKALKTLSKISLKNFFSTSTCDIEQDIYRLDFDAQDALHQAIWFGKNEQLKSLSNKDAQIIFSRFRMANFPWGKKKDKRADEVLRQYALYRYGGQAVLDRFNTQDPPRCSETFVELLEQLEAGLASGSTEDQELMKALKTFYQQSEIYRVAGSELLDRGRQAEASAG